MSEIKVGDLVRIARAQPCCGNKKMLGRMQIVAEFREGTVCMYCARTVAQLGNQAAYLPGIGLVLISRLKKIPPLNELEDQTEERKVEV